ncbi:hypothetical protein GCM10017322_23170 [Paracoccus aerius]|nr:hypothetical protein GCM10017322_23170 [Paracoccus aerius]
MSFLDKSPVKVSWDKVSQAAMAADAAYSIYPAIDGSGWKPVNLRTIDAGSIPKKNITFDGFTFLTNDGRGAAVLLQKGKGDAKEYMLSFRGTDNIDDLSDLGKNEIVSYFRTATGSYMKDFKRLLSAVDDHIGSRPGDLTVTGHSLGGWITNKLKSDILKFDGDPKIWKNADYIAFESPLLRKNVFNFGFQNDPIYKALSPRSTGVGTDRVWVDTEDGDLPTHDLGAVRQAIDRLEAATLAELVSFGDNVFIRTLSAKGPTVASDFGFGITGRNYDDDRNSFYVGSTKNDVFRLNLHSEATNYVSLGQGEDRLFSVLDTTDVVVGKEHADVIWAGGGDDIISGDGNIRNYEHVLRDVWVVGHQLTSALYADWYKVSASGSYSTYGAIRAAGFYDGKLRADRRPTDGANDQLYGEAGNDILFAGDGDDRLDGGAGSDLLLGGNGRDKLYGGTHNDVLNGGSGADLMVGGTGRDLYLADPSDTLRESKDGGLDVVVALRNGTYNLNNVEAFMLADQSTTARVVVNELDHSPAGNAMFYVGMGQKGSSITVENNNPNAIEFFLDSHSNSGSDEFIFTDPFVEGSEINVAYARGSTIDLSSHGIKDLRDKTLDFTRSFNIADGLYFVSGDTDLKYMTKDKKVYTSNVSSYDYSVRNLVDDDFDYLGTIVQAKGNFLHTFVGVVGGSLVEWEF